MSTTQEPTEKYDLAHCLEFARKKLGFETLDARGVDRLDFRDVHVDAIREIVMYAYAMGATNNPRR